MRRNAEIIRISLLLIVAVCGKWLQPVVAHAHQVVYVLRLLQGFLPAQIIDLAVEVSDLVVHILRHFLLVLE